jgi:hypothetical protein
MGAKNGQTRHRPQLLRHDDQGGRLFRATVEESGPCRQCKKGGAMWRFAWVGREVAPPKVPDTLMGPYCDSLCFNRSIFQDVEVPTFDEAGNVTGKETPNP